MAFLSEHKKSHSCGALRASDVGKQVVLCGWVATRRDHGGAIFIDLRDSAGLTQIVFKAETNAAAHEAAGALRSEWCIGVVGTVESRGDNKNPNLATGEIEVTVTRLEVFSRAETPPFPIEDQIETNEALRLKHRYLDLRRPSLQKNFLVRSMVYSITRNYFYDNSFVELETPFMVKYTPGGARNFLVPSRLNPGCFYALAESPQIFKQLFMVAGFGRYMQITRCFRDEDLRLDRQPEFTQIDLEMSFVEESDVQTMMEGLIAALWKGILGHDVPRPFLRMSYDEAMLKYGSDKPDLRNPLELVDITEAGATSGVNFFNAPCVKALKVAGSAEKLPRSWLDGLPDFAKPYGGKGIAYAKIQEAGTWQAGWAKNLTDGARAAITAKVGGLAPGDTIFFVADKYKVTNNVLGALRLHLGEKLGLTRKDEWRFLWVTDMPLFEQGDDGKWAAAHHPFTSPRLADLDYLTSDPGRCRARAYDCVLNGNEIGGGSIRIHQPDVQAKLFGAIGLSDEEARQKFGFLLDAFKFGPPPHGGIAYGVDRLAMLLCGADSLRDVIAFPKTQKGTDLMTEAPSPVADRQLSDLHIQLKKS
jgi:aspartyl-tRNA synthetase